VFLFKLEIKLTTPLPMEERERTSWGYSPP